MGMVGTRIVVIAIIIMTRTMLGIFLMLKPGIAMMRPEILPNTMAPIYRFVKNIKIYFVTCSIDVKHKVPYATICSSIHDPNIAITKNTAMILGTNTTVIS